MKNTKNKKVIFNDKVYIQIIVTLNLVLIASLLIWAFLGYTNNIESGIKQLSMVGSYSADDGEWQPLNSDKFVNKGYTKVVFKGKFSQDLPKRKFVTLSLCDVWGEMKINGITVAENYAENKRVKTDTPGHSIKYIPSEYFEDDYVIELIMKSPYPANLNKSAFSDTFNFMVVGDKSALYEVLLKYHTFGLFVGLAVIFFGLFGFGFSGILFAKNKYNYFAFAFVAISCGLYMITDEIFQFLPLWIDNPFLCMLIDKLPSYLIVLAICVYIKGNVANKTTVLIMDIAVTLSFFAMLMASIMQFAGFSDILSSEIYLYPAAIIGLMGGFSCIIVESFKFKNKNSQQVLIALSPIILAELLEYINGYLSLWPERILIRVFMIISIFIQLVFLIKATVAHYKSVIKYQKLQTELLQSRISIMVSQIQPHFLYNSLTSIAMLCEKNPKMAKTATIEFADYLRGNMNSLKEKNPVPFSNELKHLKTYLSLEKMRFGEDLNIVYDIQASDFMIPSLTVQPLVENAVKHGVGMKDDGGTVTIATREDEKTYQVIITDDGVGFDVNEKKNDGRQHVGMENCKSRLKEMVNGEVIITSKRGEGTVSKIIIPKGEE